MRAHRKSPRCAVGKTNPDGFTLLELMVVMLILALLAAVATPRVTRYLARAKTESAKIQVDALDAAVEAFQFDVGRLPTQEENLRSLLEPPPNAAEWDGPYLKKRESLLDPWGRPYRYRCPGRHGYYEVYSLGADDREGGGGESADVGI